MKNVRVFSLRVLVIPANQPPLSLRLQKNKSAKVQKYVQQVQNEQARAGKSPAALAKEKEFALRAKEKAAEEKRKKGLYSHIYHYVAHIHHPCLLEEAELFKPVQAIQKVPFGVGKSASSLILCALMQR